MECSLVSKWSWLHRFLKIPGTSSKQTSYPSPIASHWLTLSFSPKVISLHYQHWIRMRRYMYLHAGLVPGLDHCVDNDTICAAVGLNFWGTDDKCLSNMVSTAERVWSQTKVETLLVWAPYMPGQLCILLCAHQSISEAGATVVQTTYLDPPAWWMVITSKHFILFLICLLG